MRPFLRYPGGKSLIANKIANKLPPHKTYVEPMIGGGSVYFAKNPSNREIISDIDKSLIGFYKSLKKGDIKKCNMTPNKNKFERLRSKSKKGKSLEPCEYLYLNKLSYGGKMGTTMDPSVWKDCKGKSAKTCKIISKNQKKFAERLKNTKIESGDYRKIIKKYDSKDTAFYIDPPYVTETKDHYRYGEINPKEVKKVVDKIKGKFIMSYNDTTDIKKLFCKDYKCEKIKTKYSINKNLGNNVIKTELLIKNFICKKDKNGKFCKKV